MSGLSSERVLLRRLALRDFRNLEQVIFEPASRLNLVYGHNGHGKTSLIEALYVLSTTKSFRSSRLQEVVREGGAAAEIRGQFETLGISTELSATINARGRSFLVGGKRPKRSLDYALRTPVIAFHPLELALCSGPASVRRTLLDRILLHQDPGGAVARSSYQTALKERQRLLENSGPRARELDAYEQVAAEQGARFARARRGVAEAVVAAVGPGFARMAPSGLTLEAIYQAGGSEDAAEFQRQLAERRTRDLQRGAATFGPQRDEVFVTLGGRPARSHASQGQQRLLTLALKMAELSCVREVTGMEPMLLLDDVSSELDPERTHAVFELLRQSKSQIFVTTTRPELFRDVEIDPGSRADFHVQNGVLSKSLK